MTAADCSGVLPRTVAVRPLHGDVRAHAVELLHVHEAVLEDVFGDGGGAFGLGGEGHELGLHVGGEAGVLLGGDVGGLEVAAGADADVVVADVELDAALLRAWR